MSDVDELGIRRDSLLESRNDFALFIEEFTSVLTPYTQSSRVGDMDIITTLRRVPLAPFDSPTSWECCLRGECDGAHAPVQRSTGSKDDRIDPVKAYMIYRDGTWYLGRFSEQWYGWTFRPNGASWSAQLDMIDTLYEVDLPISIDTVHQ